MNLFKIQVFFALMLLLVLTGDSFAHGGGASHTSNVCPLTIGPYNMYFKSYQPGKHPRKAFCTILPSLGPSVLTLDFLQKELRELKTEVRVVKVKSLLHAKSLPDNHIANTIIHSSPRIYPKGMLTLKHTFEKPGHFVTLITIEDSAGQKHVGHFPFSVAMPARFLELYLLGGMVAMIGIGYVVVNIIPARRARVAHG